MELKVLGSVSPYPKDNKNGVANLVIDGDYKILLDCGTGCTRLLDMQKDLNNLSIVISHLHRDHYPDLLALSYASYVNHNLGFLKDKVKVYIPSGDKREKTKHYFRYDEMGIPRNVFIEHLEDYDYLMNFGKESYLEFIPYTKRDKIEIGNMRVEFELNPHNLKTYSAKVTTINDTHSLVYSGDTGFENNKLVDFAQDADLLICESTYLKGQFKNGDNHLYAYEASLIAEKANVKELLLTHFYPEIDKQRYVDEAKEVFENVKAAEEGKIYKIGGK